MLKTDGILTFTAKNKKGIGAELQEILERRLAADEDLLFLDFATVADRFFPRSAFLALTSRRILLFSFDIFSLTEIVSVPWWEIESLELLSQRKFNLICPGARFAELKYCSGTEAKKITFSVGHSGIADKTHALIKNLSLRFKLGEIDVFAVADSLIFHERGQTRHVRLRRWIFDAVLDERRQGIVVLLTNEAVFQQRLNNLLYLNCCGEIRWRGELPTAKGVPDSFLRAELKDDEILGYTWSGFTCKLAPETGKIMRLRRTRGTEQNQGDLEAWSEDGRHKATLVLTGVDRLGNRLYWLLIESSHFFKERLFGGQAHWSPDGRYLAVQEYFLSRLQGIQSVGVVLFDLKENREALVEKSVMRNFGPQGWKSCETLLYGQGQEKGNNTEEISVRRVFWLPLKKAGLEVYQ